MNISHDGTTVMFKTESQELYETEKSGAKSNTVRIIDNDEYEMLNMHTPKKIFIQYQQERFIRTLTNLHFAKLFGKVIVIFSWANPDQEAHIHSVPYEPSIEERFMAITISKGTLTLLQSIAHGRTMDMVIQELYERYMFHRAEERGPLHD